MIRYFGGHEVYLCVVSSGRPDKAAALEELIGRATWHVPADQVPAYFAALAGPVVPDSTGGMNVAAARNGCLDAAGGRTCLMLDDDLKPRITRLTDDGEERITFDAAMAEFLDRLADSGLKFAGTSHITNGLFARSGPPDSTRAIINGGCLAMLPSPIRFDEAMPVNEDVDFMLRHWQAYGGALRVNDLLLRFGRGTPGGVQVYRDEALRRHTTALLVERYPDLVKASPRDPGHPMLVRRKRVVL